MNKPEERWIVIPNWERFQHYKERNPKWIKIYTDLLDNPAYLGLTGKQRGLLHSIWMLYARSAGRLPASPAYIAQRTGGLTEWEARRVRKELREDGESVVRAWREHGESLGEWVVRGRDIKALEKAGFIELTASKPLAIRDNLLAQREVSKETSPRRARTREAEKGASLASAQEENNHQAEPERDPDAAAKIKAMATAIGRPIA